MLGGEGTWRADGGSTLKQYDTNNSHPYNELDVTKASDGKVTAAQVTLDPNVLAAGLSIGQIFGSALGGALGGNSLVGNLAGGASFCREDWARLSAPSSAP